MGHSTYLIVKALHVFGVLFWTAGLIACSTLLLSGKSVELGALAKKAMRLTGVAALIAIGSGVVILITTHGEPGSLLRQPWMHAKLTLAVVGYFGLHGFAEARVGKAARGQEKRFPRFFVPGVVLIGGAIVYLVVAQPF